MELNITLKAYLSIDPISFRTPITQYFLAKYVLIFLRHLYKCLFEVGNSVISIYIIDVDEGYICVCIIVFMSRHLKFLSCIQ